VLLARQRLRQQRTDRQPGVVGESDVAHRAAATLGAGQAEEPQHGRRHHRGLAGADHETARDQQSERADERGDRADGHHDRAGDHDPRRPQVIGQPSAERAPGRAGERRRPDGEADEHCATAQ
jgi:hypothetical protein